MPRLRNRPTALSVRVELRGDLLRADAEYARAQAAALLPTLGPDVRTARLRLTRIGSRAVTRPVIAQVGLESDGTGPVRVQLSAVTAREAVDLAIGTLLGRATRLRECGEIGLAAAYESAYRPQFAPRPLAARRIVRHKTVIPALRTPDEAVRELLALDRHFHLFADAATGQDTLVHRQPATGDFRLVRARPAAGLTSTRLPLAESPVAAPELDLAEAARQLWLTGGTFVFHRTSGTDRAQVLYRRYDGHYGLITSAADPGFRWCAADPRPGDSADGSRC